MASRYYCSSVAGELEVLSQKLHKLSSEIDGIPSIDKYKLQPQIDDLHIIMTELDDRLCELIDSCESAETYENLEADGTGEFKVNFAEAGNERFDYDIGG